MAILAVARRVGPYLRGFATRGVIRWCGGPPSPPGSSEPGRGAAVPASSRLAPVWCWRSLRRGFSTWKGGQQVPGDASPAGAGWRARTGQADLGMWPVLVM